MNEFTLDDVIRRLFDGLSKTNMDCTLAHEKLTELLTERNLSIGQLDDLCFADSNAVFDYIYS